MNRKHNKIFAAIFCTPTIATIKFTDIEKLLISIGAEVTEGNGSRVAYTYKGLKLFLHRPHPGKEARKYQVEAVREFLEMVGIRDE